MHQTSELEAQKVGKNVIFLVEFTLLFLNRNHAQPKQVRPNCFGRKKTQERTEEREIEKEEKEGKKVGNQITKKVRAHRFFHGDPFAVTYHCQTKTAYTMLKSGLSAFSPGIRLVSKTHRNGFMDD